MKVNKKTSTRHKFSQSIIESASSPEVRVCNVCGGAFLTFDDFEKHF